MVTKFADKKLIKLVNAEAGRQKYNRQLDDAALDTLADDAILALSPLIVHEHAQGKPVDPHFRCSVRFVHPSQIAWDGLMLDVPMHMFELLPSLQDLQKEPV